MNRRRAMQAVAAGLLVLLWQFLTVHYNYGGNWTALFCTGEKLPIPPQLRSENIYQFPSSFGYDGQQYHYIAHDPLFQTDIADYVDTPRERYRRILLPALAYVLAAGQQRWIDGAYIAVCCLSVAAGVYLWGLAFLLLPAVIVSVDRLTVDIVLAVLCAAAVRFESQAGKLYAVLVLAALARETGLLLIAGYCLYYLTRKEWLKAGLFGTSALPCLAWYAFVAAHTKPFSYPSSWVPLAEAMRALFQPADYPRYELIARTADVLALLGMLLAFALTLRRPRTSQHFVALLFAVAGLFPQHGLWTNVYNYGRVFTPILMFLGSRSAVPLALMLPRVAVQLGPQVLGVWYSALGYVH